MFCENKLCYFQEQEPKILPQILKRPTSELPASARADLKTEIETSPSNRNNSEFETAQTELEAALTNPKLGQYFEKEILPKILATSKKIEPQITSSNLEEETDALKEIANTLSIADKELTKFPQITEEEKFLLLSVSAKILNYEELKEKLSKRKTIEQLTFVVEIMPFIGSAVNFRNAVTGETLGGQKVSRIKEALLGIGFLGLDTIGLLAAIPSGGTSAGGAFAARTTGAIALRTGAKAAGKAGIEAAAKGAVKGSAKGVLEGGIKAGAKSGIKRELGEAAFKATERQAIDPQNIANGLRILEELAKGEKFDRLGKNLGKGAKLIEDYPKAAKAAEFSVRKSTGNVRDDKKAAIANAAKALDKNKKFNNLT